MYKIEFICKSLQKKLENIDINFPTEVNQELPYFLESLKKTGQISKATFCKNFISKVSAHTFELTYKRYPDKNTVLILEIKINSLNILKDRFSIQDSWNDKDVLDCIPQYDKPDKLIKGVELIYTGVKDSYSLGWELGHRGKQKKYISRHGQYAQSALEELRLITRHKKGRKLVPELTEKGKLLAEAPNLETKERLLIESMLSYRPIWLILGAVTEGDEELCDALVKKIIFPPEFQSADTSNRRAQTMKNYVKWISRYCGIPIRIQGQSLQLTIPMLFTELGSEQDV